MTTHWQSRQLSEVCSKISDGTHHSPELQFSEAGKGRFKYITSKNIRNGKLDLQNIAYVDEATHREIFSRCNPEVGDVLLTKDGANTGNVTINTLEEEFSLLSSVALLKPDREILDPRFLQYFLQSPLGSKRLLGKMTGTAIRRIILKKIKETTIPIPPLEEQKGIVAEIEKQLSRLDAGVAALKRVQANLKRYRAAVLKAACEGKLVATDGRRRELPLKALIGKISQGWSPQCELNRDALVDEWAVVTTTAVQPLQYLDNQGKPLPTNLKPRAHLEIKPGDFLMTRKGPRKRAGVVCLVRSTRPRLMVCDTVYRFRCDETQVTPPYLELALNSPSVVEEIDRQKAGINESGVSLTHGKLGVIMIPVPPLAEQKRIVAELENRIIWVEGIERILRINFRRAVRFRESFLKSKFER